MSLALGAEATFVARTIDSDRKHLTEVLRAAAAHEGTALVEIYQNCNIFNDGAFELLKDPDTRDESVIRLEHGEPMRFGRDGVHGVVQTGNGSLKVVDVADVDPATLLVHDAHAQDPSTAFALSRLADITTLDRSPIGVFRDIQRPAYDRQVNDQLAQTRTSRGEGDLATLLAGQDTWVIG